MIIRHNEVNRLLAYITKHFSQLHVVTPQKAMIKPFPKCIRYTVWSGTVTAKW